MMKKLAFFLMLVAVAPGLAGASDLKVLVPGHAAEVTFQVTQPEELLISATRPDGSPLRNLQKSDFLIGDGLRKAEVLSAQPLETTQNVPLNIVLVIDNSFSMLERQAVKPLLTALNAFIQTVRPIDNVHVVVFGDEARLEANGRSLNAVRFASSEKSELEAFLQTSFEKGLTSKTYLYEAILAGIDIVQKMPEGDQKFLVVFSDGEDLNSAFTTSDVEVEAFGIKNLEVYCVDYMPGPEKDDFLASFAHSNKGRIWKAQSAEDLIPIFQAFSTTLLYRYVVRYRLTEPVTLSPPELQVEMLTSLDGSMLGNKVFFEMGRSELPEKYVRFESHRQAESFDFRTLGSLRERYFNILNLVGQGLKEDPGRAVRLVGHYRAGDAASETPELARRRAETVRDYLERIWHIGPERLTVDVGRPTETGVSPDVPGASAEKQRVEIHYAAGEPPTVSAIAFAGNTGANPLSITVTTGLFTAAPVASWEMTLKGDEAPLQVINGENALQPHFTFPLEDLNIEELADISTIEARVTATDTAGRTYEAASDLCHVRVARKTIIPELIPPPAGVLSMEPEVLTIEELTTVDSSPLLNFVYFESGQSDIPPRYNLLSSQSQTESFDEYDLKGAMEKYYHVLNIFGKRLQSEPSATIRIVGCNSDRGEEKSRIDLSRGRAESVRAYLRYIWGIDLSRMTVEARNLPEAPSNGNTEEGRRENQRVEIHSDLPAVMDTVRSTYVSGVCDIDHVMIQPEIRHGYDIARWSIRLYGDAKLIETLEGRGRIAANYYLDLKEVDLLELGAYQNLRAVIEVTDSAGQDFQSQVTRPIRFIKREERQAQRQGYRVIEKYALILFDFDSAAIQERNKLIMDRILERVREVPAARVRIVGHTDTIGKEAYNLELSRRRAEAAYRPFASAGEGLPIENITHEGVGQSDPLYANELPEGRALNRTVTVTLEYEQQP
jgi:outer membrane protein OmpA-like peptidoglycan-associated protein